MWPSSKNTRLPSGKADVFRAYAYARFWSHALAGCGIGPGRGVLLWGANSAEWVGCFWGILLRGAVVFPWTPRSPEFVRRAIKDSGVSLFCARVTRWNFRRAA